MADSNLKLEEMRLAMEAAARAKNEAARLQEKRRIVRAQLVKKYRSDGEPVGLCRDLAMASEQYENASNEAFIADLQASLAEADADWRKIEWDTWRTKAANRRAEMTA